MGQVAPQALPADPGQGWFRKALRVVGLLIFVVVGSVAAKGRPANGVYYHGTGEIIGALVIGAIISFIFLFVVGWIGYAISVWVRRSDRTWREVTFGPTVMIVTLVLLILSAGGRAAQHRESVSKAKPNPSGSATQRERANRDAVAWGQKTVGPDKEINAWLVAHRQLLAGLSHGNTPAVRATAVAARGHLLRALALTQSIPDFPEQDLNAERDRIASIIQVDVRGYDLYLTGLRRNARSGLPLASDKASLAFLDEGDVLINKAARRFRSERAHLHALDRKYGL
jgi:hypothetical protein